MKIQHVCNNVLSTKLFKKKNYATNHKNRQLNFQQVFFVIEYLKKKLYSEKSDF